MKRSKPCRPRCNGKLHKLKDGQNYSNFDTVRIRLVIVDGCRACVSCVVQAKATRAADKAEINRARKCRQQIKGRKSPSYNINS